MKLLIILLTINLLLISSGVCGVSTSCLHEIIKSDIKFLVENDIKLYQEEAWRLRRAGKSEEARKLESKIEEILRRDMVFTEKNTQKVLAGKDSQPTAGHVLIVKVEPDLYAVYKLDTPGNMFTNHKFEVAAYKIDRLWGFDFVPVTVSKEIEGTKWSIQYFVKNAKSGDRAMPDVNSFQRQRIFDFLIGNQDRTGRNQLVHKDGKLVAIDHGVAFRPLSSHHGHAEIDELMLRYIKTDEGRKLLQKIKQTTPEQVKESMKGLLTDEQIDFVLKQRETFLKKSKDIA